MRMRRDLRLVDASGESRIRVVLAEDHATMRRSLRLLLDIEHDIEVLAEASELSAAISCVRRHRPGVLVLDLRLPNGSTIDAIRDLREGAPATEIVVVTMQQSLPVAMRVLQAGAQGFVLKDSADAELVEAVRRAARGQRFASPRLEGTPGLP
jgi:two-component system, NarL family, response regulator NreC